jgi:hypothetical protein
MTLTSSSKRLAVADGNVEVIDILDDHAPARVKVRWTGGPSVFVVEQHGVRYVVYNRFDHGGYERFAGLVNQLTADERQILLGLAEDWHGTPDELVEAVKGLA